jgi:transposase-like protein
MDFPIVDLLDDDVSAAWLLKYFHPHGFKCPACGAGVHAAREFRRTRRSQLTVYRCRRCQSTYTLYSGTVFQGKHLHPAQVVLLLRGVCKGESSATLARELKLSRQTVHDLRHTLHAKAEQLQPTTHLPDRRTETDEAFQNAGEKRRKTQRSG